MEARGVITAIHDDSFSMKRDLKDGMKKYINKKTVKTVGFFDIRIPLGYFDNNGEYDEFEEKSALFYGNVRLPFYILKTTRAYYDTSEENDEEKSLTLFFDDFTEEEYSRYKNTLMLEKETNISEKGNTATAAFRCECIDFMGVKQKISFEE